MVLEKPYPSGVRFRDGLDVRGTVSTTSSGEAELETKLDERDETAGVDGAAAYLREDEVKPDATAAVAERMSALFIFSLPLLSTMLMILRNLALERRCLLLN